VVIRKALVTPQDTHIADAIALGEGGIRITWGDGGVVAVEDRHEQRHPPVRVGAVVQCGREVAVEGLLLDLLLVGDLEAVPVYGFGARAQLILVEVVVAQVEAEAGPGSVALGRPV
jgi:hypothetical protein